MSVVILWSDFWVPGVGPKVPTVPRDGPPKTGSRLPRCGTAGNCGTHERIATGDRSSTFVLPREASIIKAVLQSGFYPPE